MFKALSQFVSFGILLVSHSADALQCRYLDPADLINKFDTIFVAFISEAHYVEDEEANGCGWIEGYYNVAEELKGNPDLITSIRMRLSHCNNRSLAGHSDQFPIGKQVLIYTNDEVARIGTCSLVWNLGESECLVDDIRRQLDISAPSSIVRQTCLEYKEQRTLHSYIRNLRREIWNQELTLKELKEGLEEAEEELGEIRQ